MGVSTPQFELYLLATVVVGIGIGWLIHSVFSRRRIEALADEWQTKVDDVIRQRDRLTAEIESLRSTIETQQGALRRQESAATKARTDLESMHEKAKSLTKDLFTLRSERETTKSQLSVFQSHLELVTRQAEELQTEFIKSGDFYKSELRKSFEKRQVLEAKLENAKSEQESYSNLLVEQRSEHNSVNKILASAQTRLANLDTIEKRVIELEAENAQLNHDATRSRQEIEALRRDVAELDELKIQNKELAHCLTSMENSRQQYEADANRLREHAGEAENHSETLRLRLEDVERDFADMEKLQRQALREMRQDSVAQKSNGHAPSEQVVDNLQEIVGIGKAFEQALHELDVVSFAQIAAFELSDIARVNMKLKEFKGRMEQDDWIGQAKELQFKKYGGSEGP